MSAHLLAVAGCDIAKALFRCWSLLRNNNMATNLQRFTSIYRKRRFAALRLLNSVISEGNAARQRLLIEVNHVPVISYCVKR